MAAAGAHPYPGSKGRLAPWITGLLPPHRTYVEPYCGSAAVLLAKRPSQAEILNDANVAITTFFTVLRDRPEEFARACRLTPYSRDEFDAAVLDEPGIGELELARRWWVRCNQAVGKQPTGAGWSSSSERTNNAAHTQKRVARLESLAERLALVQVENRDAVEVMRAHDHAETLHYVDPPYLGSTRSGRRYAVEMTDEQAHRDLIAFLSQVAGTVVLSGYDSPLYAKLLDGWHRYEHKANKGGSGPRDVTEVVWSNRPLVAVRPLFDVSA